MITEVIAMRRTSPETPDALYGEYAFFIVRTTGGWKLYGSIPDRH